VPRKSTGEYPPNWKEIAQTVKDAAGWKCIRCSHPHDVKAGYMLTVHHLDMNPANCEWWNLAALCQKCHLQIQHKVVMERPWMLEHSAWFRPFVAGYYAFHHGLPHDRSFVDAHMDDLILIGQGRLELSAIAAT
jgi:hypothetical protein